MKSWFAAVLALVTLVLAGTAIVRQEGPAEAAAGVAQAASGGAKTGQAHLKSFDPQIDRLLAQMTLDEKVGQMTQAEQSEMSKDFSEVDALFLGSVFSGGNSDPTPENTLKDWTDMYDRLQARSQKTRLKIPILFGVDAVHGHSNVVGATIFPHNIGLGATRDAKLVEEVNRLTALEVRASGIQWAFSPCVTTPQDIRWGRTYEGFGEDPALVAEMGAAATRGLQGTDLSDPLRILGCAKHFIGDGATNWGTGRPKGNNAGRFPLDQGDVTLDQATLVKLHGQGYLTALKEGVGSIMPSYNSWNGVKASASEPLLTGLLKKEMGFEGFLISDYNALDDIPGGFRTAIKTSINAGMDMVMVPAKYKEFYGHLKSLAQSGEVPMARIDDAVRRILRVKFAMGLMDPKRNQLADRSLQPKVGSEEHRKVARQAVRESLVLLKNDQKLLPIAATAKRVHVAGVSANDIGIQCGGWTIAWQGKAGAITKGTTILDALKAAVKPGTQVTYAADGSGATGADLAIVVVGERPYAEMFGDSTDLAINKDDLAALAAVKASGVPYVVVVLSGRPVILGDIASEAGAIVAAWWPGTEGAGVADVLTGAYKPTGKLSFTWPKSLDQLPLKRDGSNTPLYAYGYGLTY
jgi:beta-glucosidase